MLVGLILLAFDDISMIHKENYATVRFDDCRTSFRLYVIVSM